MSTVTVLAAGHGPGEQNPGGLDPGVDAPAGQHRCEPRFSACGRVQA